LRSPSQLLSSNAMHAGCSLLPPQKSLGVRSVEKDSVTPSRCGRGCSVCPRKINHTEVVPQHEGYVVVESDGLNGNGHMRSRDIKSGKNIPGGRSRRVIRRAAQLSINLIPDGQGSQESRTPGPSLLIDSVFRTRAEIRPEKRLSAVRKKT